jgi:hypothetical protein
VTSPAPADQRQRTSTLDVLIGQQTEPRMDELGK